jgi:hypothetical protein
MIGGSRSPLKNGASSSSQFLARSGAQVRQLFFDAPESCHRAIDRRVALIIDRTLAVLLSPRLGDVCHGALDFRQQLFDLGVGDRFQE